MLFRSLVADAQTLPALTGTPLPWPLLVLDSGEVTGVTLSDADRATLTRFLRQVWERHLPRSEA